jgi:hypothetical protein
MHILDNKITLSRVLEEKNITLNQKLNTLGIRQIFDSMII